MRERIIERCDLLVENRNKVMKAFRFNSEYMGLAGAAIITSTGLEADIDNLKECEKILKRNTGILSTFRGNLLIPVICKMSTKPNPEAYIEKVIEIHKIMDSHKFCGSEYRIFAAMTIADNTDSNDYIKYITRTEEIYSRMKKEHSILTSYDDIPYAAVLAVSDISVNHLIDDMEESYKILRKRISSMNPVQSLSHVLALQPSSPEAKCDRAIKVYEALKANKRAIGPGDELPVVGTLSLLNMSENVIVDYIAAADDALKSKKGFSSFTLGTSSRRMFAAQAVLGVCGQDASIANNTITAGMLAIVLAIETAIITSSMAASTAATNAGNC